MALRFRSLVVIAVPLLMLGGLVLLSRPEKKPPAAESTGPAGLGWISMDLSVADALDKIPGWDVRRGNYRIGITEGRHVLEQLPEPVIEGKVLWTRAMRGGGGVRARMRGGKTRRAFPRFSVGLHEAREFHLRAFPGERKLELVTCDPDLTNEKSLAQVPLSEWAWKPEDWTWLELQITQQSDGGSRCEGRLWKEGQGRPEKALLLHQLTLAPTVLFAALQGAPYALRSIVIDAAETLPPTEALPEN